ncbi:MAG: ATP12 family protein [Pseudomonadota bacterium]
MSEWALKRFWTAVSVAREDDGYAVLLDGRGVKTPAKKPLHVPSHAAASLIAAEWEAQVGQVDPTTMPHTRMANAAIDKVAVQFDEVANLLSDFGETDLLCYRAEGPEGLRARQAEAWDPLLAWANEQYGAKLTPVTGVMFAPQAPKALEALRAALQEQSNFELAALHDLISLTGSLVMGLAASQAAFDSEQLWAWSRIDDSWQIEQWGEDEEAMQVAEIKHRAFQDAYNFYHAVRVLPAK